MSKIKQEFDAAMAQLNAPGAPFELAGSDESGRYYAKAPANLVEALSVARQHGDREFLIYENERRSFNELMDEADAIAATLQARGVIPGERVALAMRNYPEWMAIFIGVVSVGAVIVPVNSWGKPADIAYTVEDCGARLAFCDQQRYDGVAELFRDKGIDAIIARPADAEDINGLDAFVADFRGRAPAPVTIGPEDLVLIMYTSGTSGKPKGAASTHRAICQALYNIECAAAAAAMSNGELIKAMLERGFESTSLLAVPLFHVTGLVPVMLMAIRIGTRIVMMHKWEPGRALELIERERVNSLVGVPTMSWDLLEHPDFTSRDTSSLVSVGGGGAPMPPELVKRIDRSFAKGGPRLGYGMTETNAYGPGNSGRAYLEHPTSTGRIMPIVDMIITDDDGNELPTGETGEIRFKGPNLIRGYWNRPEATAETIVDGWLRTGDIGRIDADGFLYISDRAKDMILRGGENVYCAEVESAIYTHPSVYEAAVYGLPHPRLGEEVAAHVMVKPDKTLEAAELQAYLREHIAGFKVPTVVTIVTESLPRNASGKMLKRALRDQLVKEREAR